MNDKLVTLIQKEISYLQSITINVKQPRKIKIEDIKNFDKNLFEDLASFNGLAIYIITINTDFEDFDLNKIKENFKIIKNEKQIAMCRLNEKNWGNTQNKCLYVGSSKEIIKRLKEHLGINEAKKTYALHLNKWWGKENINIDIYEFDNNENNEKDVQTFEDLLWEEYKPLFGRQGKK